MTSKTPQFNEALNKILKDVKSHDRTCAQCATSFRIYEEDIEFYYMFRVPPPKLCPLCRKQRRIGHQMRLPIFYKRKCQAPGHSEEVITVYPYNAPHTLYDFSYWHSDAWDPTSYSHVYDLSQPFFNQFRQLFIKIPHVPLDRDPGNVNSDYSLGGRGSRNAYYSSAVLDSENISYGWGVAWSHDVVDAAYLTHSQLCFDVVNANKLSNAFGIIDSRECIDSGFLFDCKNCSHCFLSANLRNKSYVLENIPLGKDEYEKKMRHIVISNREVFKTYRERFDQLMKKIVRRATTNVNAINSQGDLLTNCKDCFYVFFALESENVRYADGVVKMRDSMDILNEIESERLYECMTTLGAHCRFTMYSRSVSYLEYCSECFNCHYCFGCVGLKNKQFHIFNKPYREEEYWEKIDEIKTKMLSAREYGEFFPLSLNLVPYQISNASIFFPLTKNESAARGIEWYADPVSEIPAGTKVRRVPDEVPADIKEVSDNILNEAIICEKTGKPFRVVPQELALYRKMNLPLPTIHPWERMKEHIKSLHPIWLYPFSCSKCGKASFTVYPPEQQKEMKILCEECYLKEVV